MVRECLYNDEVVRYEAEDRGDYLIVLQVEEPVTVAIGSKGDMHFDAGYYIYVGSAKANLEKRIERHKRKRKQKHWHLDYLRSVSTVVATLPIRSSSDLECELAKAMKVISIDEVKGFGCSDCQCESHLFKMDVNPIHDERFMIDVVEQFRMNRLNEAMLAVE